MQQRHHCHCCWPFSGHHWYKPVVPTRLDVVLAHTWHFSACCISPTARKLARGLLQCSLLLTLMLLLVLWLGSTYEQYHVRMAESTVGLYNEVQDVCGILLTRNVNVTATTNATVSKPEAVSVRIKSFPSIQALEATNTTNTRSFVAHCGDCGSCSNPHDINIYNVTRETLFQDTTNCAKKALIWGRKTATKCLNEEVSFTKGCTDCWVENILCDLRKCIFTCMLYGLFSQVDGVGASHSTALNPCTTCDEKRCGPAFLKCAGANRRRSHIVSDIERNATTELCHSVTPGWWNDPDLQRQWVAEHPGQLSNFRHPK